MNLKRFVLSGALVLIACGPVESPETNNKPAQCSGAKCDTPTDNPDYNTAEACADRRKDVLAGNRRTFDPGFIRWSCADVDGVNARNQDDRGQEYCEYFAMVQLPDLDDDTLTGPVRDLGRVLEGGEETSPLGLELEDDVFDWYDDHADDVVGSCVFTSWHEDIPALKCEADDSCPTLLGDVSASQDLLRMKVGINSNSAARDLLLQCMLGPSTGYQTGDDDPVLEDGFLRGCYLADDLYSTGWRFSDSSICAAGVRLAECGCGVSGATSLEEAVESLIPAPEAQIASGEISLRGFPLGGWSGLESLPSGCSYLETGDDGKTLVTCELYASDVLDNLQDLKGMCRKRYGDNVVVHVPIAQDQISCTPPAEGRYNTCSETPWVLSDDT